MKTNRTFLIGLLSFTVLTSGYTAWGSGPHKHDERRSEAKEKESHHHGSANDSTPYLLPNDPVSGQALAQVQKPIVMNHKGREIRFASQASVQKFQANPKQYLASIDKQMIQMQKPFYPLTTCPISGDKLKGEMGDPVDYLYKNRLVRFCCKGCIRKFLKDPADTLEKLDEAAIAAQKHDYPVKTCLVSGQKLDGAMGDAVDRVFGGRLIRFCCKGCIKKFVANPQKYLAKLDAAALGTSSHKQSH